MRVNELLCSTNDVIGTVLCHMVYFVSKIKDV